VLALPDKTIDAPSKFEQFRLTVLPNLGFTIPLWIAAVMAIVWAMYGKDPAKRSIAVQFDPPDDISGPEAGTLIDERVDQRDLAAGIISLAVKGYLNIHPKDVGLAFKSRTADIEVVKSDAGSDLTEFEAKLLGYLAASGDSMVTAADLRTHVAPHLSSLQNLLYKAMVSRGYYKTAPDDARLFSSFLGLLGCAALGFLFFIVSPFHDTLPSIVGGIMGAIIVLAFGKIMPRRTDLGARACEKLRGFEEFMRRAKGQEMEWMTQQHPDQALFEKYLPHAIAFGLTAEWAAAFVGIVQQMPTWYVSPYGNQFTPIFFASDLGVVSSALSTAAATPPRSAGASGGSSGFGGGGFSGGGFGGGGGGSW
jgi:hypothetical protein